MANTNKIKVWLSPAVTVSFIAVAVTGILLLFHVKNGPIHVLHELMGVILAIAGITHLIINWRILKDYFKSRNAFISLVIILVLAFVMIIAGLKAKNHNKPRPGGQSATNSQNVPQQ